MRVLAASPSTRTVERFVLAYTPVWIAVVAALTMWHPFSRFGDRFHLALGLGLAAPIALLPLFVERDQPLIRRYATRFALFIGAFSLLTCYFGSWLFFDVLGMEYHFPVTWIVNRTPLFLYFMTIAYFATYYVAMSLLWRAFSTALPEAPPVVRLFARLALGYAVAFAETGSMANDQLRAFFSYRDKHFALLWGSICYGSLFVISLPFFQRLEEREGERRSLAQVMRDVLVANMLVMIAYELFARLARPA